MFVLGKYFQLNGIGKTSSKLTQYSALVEINLFDTVAVLILLFSDISRVKHNIGLTLFGYFTSA